MTCALRIHRICILIWDFQIINIIKKSLRETNNIDITWTWPHICIHTSVYLLPQTSSTFAHLYKLSCYFYIFQISCLFSNLLLLFFFFLTFEKERKGSLHSYLSCHYVMGGGGQFLTLQLKNEETNINMHAKQIDDFEPYNICVGHADKIENVGTRLFCYRSHIDINKIGSAVNKYEYCSCRIISTKLVITDHLLGMASPKKYYYT